MTPAASRETHKLMDRLPPVRGRLTADAPLHKMTWFRTGGPAEALFRPADVEDLAAFLAKTPGDVPITVLGVGSNVLVRDGGVRGVVIRLQGAFAALSVEKDRVRAGAGAFGLAVSNAAQEAGLAGLEFLSGIPGGVGGAVRMNAGAYGSEVKDVLVSATALDRSGQRHELALDNLGYAYRHSSLPKDWIVTEAVFRGAPGDPAAIAARMTEIAEKRTTTQPIKGRTGGSTFKNPGGADTTGVKAWRLIEEAGCRGLSVGDAQVSEKHCNFLLNKNQATAQEIESLGEIIISRVKVKTGVNLEWEIERIGETRYD
ncbi:MAG: UDP-N-acetylmuramate dehydrogenase [Alphaproteobacteria bacterium]|nr:UDP-N-acetylmuramate dehydrogenase [Alphaproteobacteria bacterium]